jgi:hypothetical protein
MLCRYLKFVIQIKKNRDRSVFLLLQFRVHITYLEADKAPYFYSNPGVKYPELTAAYGSQYHFFCPSVCPGLNFKIKMGPQLLFVGV